MFGDVGVGCLATSAVVEVVVEHDAAARRELGPDPPQAGVDGVEPVAVDVGERDGPVDAERVVEQPAVQLHVLADGDAEVGERLGHPLEQVVLVAVVDVAAQAGRGARRDLGVTRVAPPADRWGRAVG